MEKCDNIKSIYFYETENAFYKGEFYQKKQIVEKLEEAILSAEKKKIMVDSNRYSIIYKFTINDMHVDLHISKKYEKLNQEYINIFNSLIRKNRKKQLKTLKLLVITSAISAGVTAISYEPAKETLEKFIVTIENLLTDVDEVEALENELLIHSGYGYTPDGRNISPFLGHGCIFSTDKELSVEQRISLYCEEHDLTYMASIAIEKYNHLMNGNKEFADTIQLKQIEQEYNEIQKVKK